MMPNRYPSGGIIYIKEPLWILFLAYFSFRLEYVLFYQFYSKMTSFFDPEKFGTAPHLYVGVETFGGN